MQEIRKVSIGNDYKNSMHYVVGQSIFGDYVIHAIQKIEDGIVIWIEKNKEILCWKQINNNTPMVLEFNINF
ncbi:MULTISPECIES: hypothetical protein [Flavobacteriaceae]|uniref:hypothetical protein n=1 Tax=Flavobacteriaceae TaxID=49546 RepID=UPI0025D7BEB9|nr:MULTISPECIES: hypothetical protein [Flavobacteriaceae]